MPYIRLLCIFVSFLASPVVFADSSNPGSGSIGLGLGIPYGGQGLNYTHTVTSKVDLTAGVGANFGLGWVVGSRFYPQGNNSGLRLSALYGTNGVIVIDGCGKVRNSPGACEDRVNNYHGLNLAVGWGQRGDKSGWDGDIIFIVSSGIDAAKDKLIEDSNGKITDRSSGKIKIAFGYHW